MTVRGQIRYRSQIGDVRMYMAGMTNFTLNRLTLSTLAKKRKSLSRSNLVSAVKIAHINRLAMDYMSGYMI